MYKLADKGLVLRDLAWMNRTRFDFVGHKPVVVQPQKVLILPIYRHLRSGRLYASSLLNATEIEGEDEPNYHL